MQSEYRTLIDERLIQSGEKDRLKEILRLRLAESGWKDRVEKKCDELLLTKNLSVEELVDRVAPDARNMVDIDIQKEVTSRIRNFLKDQD